MIYICLFIIGFFTGLLFQYIKYKFTIVQGVIEIDPETKMCRVVVLDPKIEDPKVKSAIFIISHNAEISRDKDTL